MVHFSPKWKPQSISALLKEKHLESNTDKTLTYTVTVASVVDDLINIVTTSIIEKLKGEMHRSFETIDLGRLYYCLGVLV